MMGAGIAYVAAQAGIEVVLIDRDQEAADKGKAHAEGLLDDGVKRARRPRRRRPRCSRGSPPTPDYDALAGCDLVIEAVFEDPAVKAEATQPRRGSTCAADAIFATNTSTLPISRAGQGQPRRRSSSSASISSRRSRRWCWSRSSAARKPATGPSPRRSISCARSARPRSWSTTRGSSTPTAASSPTSTKASAWSPRASSRR